MYTNIIYFIVVLLVFSTQQPAPEPRLSLSLTLGTGFALFCLFALINRWVFSHLAPRVSGGPISTHQAVVYHRSVRRQSLLALVFFLLHVYVLDIKSHLVAIDLVRSSFTLQGLAALGLFLLYLAVVWFYSHECHAGSSADTTSKGLGVFDNLKFNLAILLPWLFISGAFDLVRLLPIGLEDLYLTTPWGQILFFAVLLVVFMLLAPPFLLRLLGCRPLPAGSRRALVERFCHHWGFHVRDVLLWPTSGGDLLTAGVMGLHQRCRYLLVTQPLLNILDDHELEAVLAHEMGHVRKYHHLLYLLFLLGYLVLAYSLFDLSTLFVLGSDFARKVISWPVPERMALLPLVTTLPLLVLLVVYFRYLFGFFIRNFERQADLQVFPVMGNPSSLISALEKTAFYSGNIREFPSWHHFSIKERVEYLLAAARRPSLLRGHSRKLKTALGLYLAGLLAIGGMGHVYHTRATGLTVDDQLLLEVLKRQVGLEPENPELHLALGTLYYQRDDPSGAIRHLESALHLDPDNPEIMNNLAWILATTREAPFFQPHRALALAEKAARASRQAHILDTLAEVYHANGRDKEALSAAKQALTLASGDRSYYRRQVEKFRDTIAEDQKTLRD
jgi:Zn-dependent protease with chaperone function